MDYVTALKQHELKVTPQRLEIIDIMYRYGHITIEKLYALLKDKFPSLSLATVYKNLNIMHEKMFVTEVKIPNQKSVYEITKKEHSHLVCQKCHNVFDIDLDLLHVKQQNDFEVDFASVVLNGVCKKCATKTL